jgi:hypothetical protein
MRPAGETHSPLGPKDVGGPGSRRPGAFRLVSDESLAGPTDRHQTRLPPSEGMCPTPLPTRITTGNVPIPPNDGCKQGGNNSTFGVVAHARGRGLFAWNPSFGPDSGPVLAGVLRGLRIGKHDHAPAVRRYHLIRRRGAGDFRVPSCACRVYWWRTRSAGLQGASAPFLICCPTPSEYRCRVGVPQGPPATVRRLAPPSHSLR